MRYLVASRAVAGHLPGGCRLIADGEMISFEQPWTFGAPLIARLDDAVDTTGLRASLGPGTNAFMVEGLEEPGSGQAYVLGGHIMRDMERFKPYAEAVPGVVKSFNGRFLARGGTVTALAGDFVPERVVLIEFPSADDALGFYISDRYAPLLKIRLATTEARLVILSRSGDLPKQVRAAAEAYLRRGG
ncbi:MAG: DUF1330 domain-containing protein [Xanthobacteraceae bacterium]|nr:DUF1330 domain-containing protein [Xanthobacteraceae bacterium]